MVYGELAVDVSPADPSLTVGKRKRPPKYSTDRQKDANTILAMLNAGFSGTTAFDMFGAEWEDEQEGRRAELEFCQAQGIPPLVAMGAPGVRPEDPAAPAAAGTDNAPAPDDSSQPSTTPNGDPAPGGDQPKARAHAALRRRAITPTQRTAA